MQHFFNLICNGFFIIAAVLEEIAAKKFKQKGNEDLLQLQATREPWHLATYERFYTTILLSTPGGKRGKLPEQCKVLDSDFLRQVSENNQKESKP